MKLLEVIMDMINDLPEKLIEQYEERIKELKEQAEYWKSQSQNNG